MIKKIITAVFCCVAFGLYAQNGTVSPYSFFGIGDLRVNGTVENQAMGGISIFSDSIHLNLRNPAGYSKLILTTYTGAISRRDFRLKSFTEEETAAVTSLDYLAIGFPIGKKAGVGFGILPFSSVGYNILAETVRGTDTITNRFSGEGGLNRVYLSAGAEVFKDLSIGGTVNFNFGTSENTRVQSVQGVQFGTLDLRTSRVNGVDFNFSANYTPLIKEKHRLYASIGVDTQANLVAENTQEIGSFSVASGQPIELITVDLEAENLKNTELKIPTTTTFGLGYGKENKWFLGAEYSTQGLSSFENTFLDIDNLEYQDASSFGIGGFFIPNYGSFESYFKRITYRVGLRMTKTGLVVRNTEINNFGITFGLGLPLGNNFSNVNVGFEVGRRGTTSADLIEETYLKINLGLSLNDKWFQKRKIN